MKNVRRLSVTSGVSILFIIILLWFPGYVIGQVRYRSEGSTVWIKGTSSLHDWEIKSDKGQLEADLVVGNNYEITGISGLRFTVEAESFKSGHHLMDKNTYKALKTNSYNSISFVLTSANIRQVNANTYEL